ncbi:UDP-N-acetylenolpyruvoylglucosamine reductase [Nostocoides japonicum T1-X7]|uniref:UDP-N-acetylenolpyruvoylglucosamine reductase n=1 Tax=Nostocoides japonicum T1-X7 TaxID=1194083 RepID=A0A077LUS5_9MICO|nr:UDP-N-acetylmuramate dehydrogenase [Tetrasphaera japonica]CCH77336.1 UDP-N-acetylenolpyruvoylglucosamine reductase [Tetrasphaera japonica T1-X7]CCH78686.1 UDP-N-acetylenolpyruvoylglucosamine reductase [Tetrasphaera japonica T1-X7]
MEETAGAALADLTTMHVGGPAARLVTVTSTDELVDAVREVDDADEPLLLLSGGSNLVVADAGFPGTVVHVATRGVAVESRDRCGGAFVRVAAGEDWDALVARSTQEGWAGIEALSGIPGRTGATPIQNVGAYGQEVAQTIASVRVWDRRDQTVRTVANADCAFTYRQSRFKGTDRYVVLDVLFQLEVADLSRPVAYAALADQLGVEAGRRVPLADAREAVLAQRRRRGMVLDAEDHDTWSCGSFFTNPILSAAAYADLVDRARAHLGPADPRVASWPEAGGGTKVSAAWLIERAGFTRGFGLPGPAALSTKHTLAVTNRGDATTADVAALARRVRDGVEEVFGVRLVAEPVLVGVEL